MIAVARHINGITINPLEYLLTEDGELELFENEEEAKKFLREQGFSDEEMESLEFEQVHNIS